MNYLYLLGILFVGLKLGGIITWSWFWVILPFLLPPAFVITCVAGLAIWKYAEGD